MEQVAPRLTCRSASPASIIMPIASLLAKSSFDPDTVKILTSAFEAAWQSIKKSDMTLSTGGNPVAIREFLAKRIIEMGQQGERNQDLLVADALAHLANSNWYPVG
jgi:hypothetical protein